MIDYNKYRKFFDEVGSMPVKQADKLLSLFKEDPKTKQMLKDYFFSNIPPKDEQLFSQAMRFLRYKAKHYEESFIQSSRE